MVVRHIVAGCEQEGLDKSEIGPSEIWLKIEIRMSSKIKSWILLKFDAKM